MALFTRESIERVREAVDMVELVGAKTELRRVGSRWSGLCPFHDERTPSFTVNAEQRLYHCFGCGEGGDAIGFVEKTEALDFPSAVELLADRYGVELQRESEDPEAEKRRERHSRLFALLDRAARFYSSYLWESAEAAPARDYLRGRGLEEETLRSFRVGFAPGAWDRLVRAATGDGVGGEELIAAGLAGPGRSGGLIDRFRGRIMFPLADARGRVRGFGARAMDGGRGPKYLNTSENELYHKGRQLFGIDLARPHAAKEGRILVVEGYTDVLALHGAGVGWAVAVMGPAVTPDQLAELARAVGGQGEIFLGLDADSSGREAMLRAARSAREKDIDLRVVEMPEGQDPAELIVERGVGAISERIAAAVPVLEFEVGRVLADGDLETTSGRERALEESCRLIADERPGELMRDELARTVADRLDVPVHYVTSRLSAPRVRGTAAGEGSLPAPDSLRTERSFLAGCLAAGPDPGRAFLRKLDDDHLSLASMHRARDYLLEHFEDPLAALSEDDPRLAELVTKIVAEAGERGSVSEDSLREGFLRLELRRLERAMKRAEREGEFTRQPELASAWHEVQSELGARIGQTA